MTASTALAKENILFQPWLNKYNGVPHFDKIKVSDFKEAFDVAITQYLSALDAIAQNEEKATFENTLTALELAGQPFGELVCLYYVWVLNLSSPELRKFDTELQPLLASASDKLFQNEALFSRIKNVRDNEASLQSLNIEQKQLVKKYYNDFVLGGANLNIEDKKKVADINQKLATLQTQFTQNLLADEENYFLELTEAEANALPLSLKEAAFDIAKEKNKEGWVIANTRSSIDPFLTYCDDRALREKAWLMFVNRGDNKNEHNNNILISDILLLRAERANLLGFETHAHYRLSNKMAKTPESAMQLLLSVWTPACARVHEEVADMQALADAENANMKIEAWDYKYYAEKVRKLKYDLDENEVKPYMQLDKLREAMFWVAGELFDLHFDQVNDVPVFHADVSVWKVTEGADRHQKGMWYFDPYAREGKKSGAWMTEYRSQYKIDGNVTTIVSNNSNFLKGKEGEPVLLSFDDARTLFHEFGHALHGLCSDVTYPKLSGTSVTTDYVEFPSQILERWLSTPEVLNKFALHYLTAEPIPQSLIDRIEKASKFNSGFATVEYLASALIDMKLHLAGNVVIDAKEFEKDTLVTLNMPREIVMRHRTPQFAHIFSDDGYSAGYYSYLWADVLSADAYNAFIESDGPYDKEVSAKLKKYVFSAGGTIDEAEAYRAFRGHDASIEALMLSRGFPMEN
jgi:peptidyl-dipeptidase Dcp